MRVFPPFDRTQLEAPQSAEVFLPLLTIAGPYGTNWFFTNTNQNVISRGTTFLSYPFEIVMPEEGEERQPRMMLRISNVDQQILQIIRSFDTAPWLAVEVIRYTAPDVVLLRVDHLRMREITVSAEVIEAVLQVDDILRSEYPADTYSPHDYPGLFA